MQPMYDGKNAGISSSTTKSDSKNATPNNHQPTLPSISLPKGGGAIRGIDEKFGANPVTGLHLLAYLSLLVPGRSGFGPSLSLYYDSGSGNGPFGFGWNLSLPSITRKTDKGFSLYQDAEESDTFILAGSEDLVPVLVQADDRKWQHENLPPRDINGVSYKVNRYRPRIEGWSVNF
jgi:Salmonella virulence plasmid 65kDa B protein